MDEKGGYDILCPFGGGKVILINGKVESAERDQTDEEADVPDEPESQATSVPLDAMDMEADLDDLAVQQRSVLHRLYNLRTQSMNHGSVLRPQIKIPS